MKIDIDAYLLWGMEDKVYLVKPFHFEELMARLRAMIRRNYSTVSNQLQAAD